MLYKLLILFFFSITIHPCVYAQEKKQEKRLYSISQFGHESFLFVKQPVKWNGHDWIRVGAVTAKTMLVMTLDKVMVKATQGEQRFYYSAPIVGGRMYGEWYAIGGVAGAFGLYGILARDTVAKKVSIELLQAGIQPAPWRFLRLCCDMPVQQCLKFWLMYLPHLQCSPAFIRMIIGFQM